MEEKSENYTREELVNHLERIFGPVIKEGNRYRFKDISKKEIAEKIAMGLTQFSSLLNPIEKDGPKSYEGIIKRVLLYEKAMNAERYQKEIVRLKKEIEGLNSNNEELKKKLKRALAYNILFFVLLIFSLAGIWVYSVLNEKLEISDGKNTSGIYVSPSPSSEDILSYHFSNVLNEMQLRAIFIRSEFMKKMESNSFIRDDSLELITAIRQGLQSAITSRREQLDKLEFMFPSGTPFVDSLASIIPTFTHQLFNCSEVEILESRSVEDLPENKTNLDSLVFVSVPLYFNKNLSVKEFAEKIQRVVQSGRSKLDQDIYESSQ